MAKQKRLPVFKIRAEVAVWLPADSCPRPVLTLVEECLATTMANQSDMRTLLRATVKGKLAHFGLDTNQVDIEIDKSEFLAAQSRSYSGSIFDQEPKWVDAVTDLADGPDREKAIRALTYLPYDRVEQRTVYGV